MDKETELRILKNFINCMPNVYRKRNSNWCVVQDILMQGTYTAGSTSCRRKCVELGISTDGYSLTEDDNNE